MPAGGRFLRDVTPLSLGTDSEVPPSMSVIIPRNTLIPASKTVTYSTTKDNQTSITIQIRQGESSNAHENFLVGKFELSGFFKSPKGVPWIDVTFAIDENGILIATAVDKTSGTEGKNRPIDQRWQTNPKSIGNANEGGKGRIGAGRRSFFH